MNSRQFSIQVSATFTAEPLGKALTFWMEQLGLNASIRFSRYGQVLQQALDPRSESRANPSGGINLFLIRLRDLASRRDPGEVVKEIGDAMAMLASQSPASQMVVLCPHPEAPPATVDVEQRLAERLNALPNVQVLTAASWMSVYPVADPFDTAADAAGGIPFTERMFAALATAVARRVSALHRAPSKVLVLDADRTLWGGACGEDGPEGLDFGGPWREVREFALNAREQGLLLCLCSKNHPADVDRVFTECAVPLGIQRDHFTGWKVNWRAKSENLRELASELNLGLDSFVFLDDNPAEIAEVSARCPGVLALRLPDDPGQVSRFFRHLWCLDPALTRTSEDRQRAEFYRQENERRRLSEAATSFEDFLRGLELQVDTHDAAAGELGRIAQLTARTNQFNARPNRLSETELAGLLSQGSTRCLAVQVSDRFGDYGLVGAALYGAEAKGTALLIEGFLLSCRAMGKGVERVMVTAMAERAREAGAESLVFAFTDTNRNEPCRRFFETIGADLDPESGGFRLSVGAAENLPLIPPEPAPKKGEKAIDSAPGAPSARGMTSQLAARIALEFSDPAVLEAFLNAKRRARPEIAQAYIGPSTATEQRLVSIWREILGLEQVGLADPFTALGGTSIQLVRVHAEILRDFGTAIDLAELFELPTIAAIARRIEGQRSGVHDRVSIQEHARDDSPVADAEGRDAVAIIGIALRVPGAGSPQQFWNNLAAGVESITRFRRDEIENPEDYDKPGYVPAKGLMDGVDLFDAAFFGILPKDARTMDPQQRIFLELAWEAMERAGYRPDTHRERIGVYAGAYFNTYLLANLCTDRVFLADFIPSIQVGSLQTVLGNDKDHLATRVAFKLNLRGPALNLQTACSTSLVAIVEACRAIRSGLCDMALAGGVTVTLPLKRGYVYLPQHMLSSDGHCRAFDARASGTVFSTGAGVVMLKRLSDALRDHDHIHAVIRGAGLNNDGAVKHSYTAPSVAGQFDAIRMAHLDAGIDVRTISYVEAHGTGTPLGDPIEVTALTKAFRHGGVEENGVCALGSLKSNIGHLDVASGVCGLIKTTLAIEHAQIPPSLHFEKPNPSIDFQNSPFYVNAALSPWKTGPQGGPRRAGVSSFGVGGTNAHVVLEEAPAVSSSPSPRAVQLFLLSARTEPALQKSGESLAHFARTAEKTDPADVASTLAIGRQPFRCRWALVAESLGQLATMLGSGAGGKGVADRSNPPVNFLFPGQGAQHIGMGADFYASEPRFRRLVDRCSAILRKPLGLDLVSVLFPGEGEDSALAGERLQNTVLAQPAIFVIEYAMADLWRHWGVEPVAMAGHSVGEFVAACHAGVFSLEAGLELLAMRGRLMGDLPGGQMLSVRLPEEALLARMPSGLDLAAVNGPALCVVSGPQVEIEAFAASLDADGVVAKALHTSHAFHSRMMDPIIERFAALFDKVELQAPKIPILSSVTGQWLTAGEATDPHYWARHLRETVRFQRAVVALGREKPQQLFLEVGPGQTLTGLVRQSLDRASGHVALSTCCHVKESGSDHANALASLGKLWIAGVEVDWEKYFSEETRRRVPLPTYPFERKRFWIDPKPLLDGPVPMAAATASAGDEDVPEVQIPSATEMSTPDPTPSSRTGALGTAVRGILAELSGILEEDMPGEASLLELGFDSLLITQVSRALQKEFKIQITMRQLIAEFPTVDAIVAHFESVLPPELYRVPAVAEQGVARTVKQPAAPVSVSQPTAAVRTVQAPAALSAPALNVAIGDGLAQRLIAQQLEVMQQQIALLRGEGVPQAPSQDAAPKAPVPVTAPTTGQSAATTGHAESRPSDVMPPSETSSAFLSISRAGGDALTELQKGHLKDLIAKYTKKTRTSKELTTKHRRWYADPRTVSGFNRLWKEMIYQIAVTRSKGSRLVDVDGNEYIDLLNGFGPNFLGHSPDFVVEALHDQLDRGIELGPQSVAAMEAAQLFCELTGNERASFVNTGSEAVQAAMRLARTVTGRDKIVVFAKDYHGNFDEVLVRGVGSGEQRRSMPIAPGIPRRAVEDVIVLPYGTDEAIEVIRARAEELAAVIIEPIQSRRPEFQPREFIQQVREITRQQGILFVFDEVITGFRTGPRGAQEFFGVEADIATYGKVVGGGMPIGIVAGKAAYMDTFDGGSWQYGDDSFPEKGVTFFAGTFVRHPLAMAAAKSVLLFLRAQSPAFWTAIRQRADRLAGSIDRMFVEHAAPFRMPNFGSQMFVRVADDQKYANLLFFHLRHKGVFLLEGFPTYMTAAHTDEDVDYVIKAFRESVAELQHGGFLTPSSDKAMITLDGPLLSGPPRILSAIEPVDGRKTEARTGRTQRVKGEGGRLAVA